MSESVLTIEDAARRLPEVVDHVRSSGESAILTKSGEPVVRIVPVATSSNHTEELINFLRRWRAEHPEPDEQFAEAIEDSRRAIRTPIDPWQ